MTALRGWSVLLVGPDHEDNLSNRDLSSALREAGHAAERAARDTRDAFLVEKPEDRDPKSG